MNATPLVFAGQTLLLDPLGAVFWPARRRLIVADLHLEKASAYASRGALLPPYDSRTTLEILLRLTKAYAPERIIALGDSFHDSGGAARLCAGDRVMLERIIAGAAVTWITGNHDPLAPSDMRGSSTGLLQEAGLEFRHIAAPDPPSGRGGEVSGHYHPKARVVTRGKLVSRRCFVAGENRLLLPALGAFSGGLDVTALPIRRLFPSEARVFLLGANRLYSFPLSPSRMEPA